MTARVMAAAVRLSGPPEVIAVRRPELPATGKNRSSAAMRTAALIDADRDGRPYLTHLFRELR